jgi:hypothetical protein
VEAAHAAARSKGTYLSAQYARLRGRLGPAKAAVAVGHSILVIAYHLLSNNQYYSDLGADFFRRSTVKGDLQKPAGPPAPTHGPHCHARAATHGLSPHNLTG